MYRVKTYTPGTNSIVNSISLLHDSLGTDSGNTSTKSWMTEISSREVILFLEFVYPTYTA